MARGGSDPVVERVREATDIVEIIGAYVQLKKMGARLGGLCPFHREKTPSFYVNPALQAFHCFGCGVGGDVFSFLMQFEKMSFPEALRYLAERAGVQLPDRRGESSDRTQRIREALSLARSWFREQLLGPAGGEGRAYLDGRGIGPEMGEAYGLGFVPDQWDGLVRHARTLLSDRILIEAGLAAESSGGRVYDRFRHRLIIPIENSAGAPVGFGGRALGDQEPKYLNSPETAVYRKGSVLFGVSAAREGIRQEDRVVLVEGYFDVIALRQAGIKGVIGSCGTALTSEQAALLRRLGVKVILLFDGDAAGRAAALRALPVMAAETAEFAVASPPTGKDPDLWVRTEGVDTVRRALDEARAPLAYLEDLVAARSLEKREAAGRAAEMLAQVRDPLTRDLWVTEAATRFGIRAEAFLQAVRQREPAAVENRGGRGQSDRLARSSSDDAEPPGPRRPRPVFGPMERVCLQTALAHPAVCGDMLRMLQSYETEETALMRVVGWIADAVHTGSSAEPGALLSQAVRELPEGSELVALSLLDGGPPESAEAVLAKIEQRGLKRRAEALTREIRRSEESGNHEELNRLLSEKDGVARALLRVNAVLMGASGRASEDEAEKRSGQGREDLE